MDILCRWGELESGQTTIAFTPARQHETDDVTGAVHAPAGESRRSPVEVCFDYEDVDAAYKVPPLVVLHLCSRVVWLVDEYFRIFRSHMPKKLILSPYHTNCYILIIL